MKIITDIYSFHLKNNKSVVTMGTFDGLHKGHQKIFKKMQSLKLSNNLASIVITYNPNPATIVSPGRDTIEILTYTEKIQLLSEYNPDYVIIIRFTRKFAKKSATWFYEEILKNKLKARHIVLGFDHAFGNNREGNYAFLNNIKDANTKIYKINKYTLHGSKISSSKVRVLIKNGEVDKAKKYLGYNFFTLGRVVKGDKRGRKLGFPTANLWIEKDKLLPKESVYIGYVEIKKKKYKSMINIGKNPTFATSNRVSVEAHILDFKGNIYGEVIKVIFVKKIRREKKFIDQNSLIEQLKSDLKKAARLKL